MNEPSGVGRANYTSSLHSRSEFLKSLGAAGAGAVLGSQTLLAQALAKPTPPGKLGVLDLTLDIVERYRNFHLIGENFVELSDRFEVDSSKDYKVFTPAPENNGGSVSAGVGTLDVEDDKAYFAMFGSGTSKRAPFASVIVDIRSFSGASGSEDTVFAGLVKDGENYVVAWYNDAGKMAGVDAVVDGNVNTLGTVEADLSAPSKFAFSLTENKVTVLAEMPPDGKGIAWRPLLRVDVSNVVDLRQPATLKEHRNGFGVRANPGGTLSLGGVEAGYFGETGTRDPHIVTYADGTPYIQGGKVYLTFTNAGMAFFETAHFGVWRLDLETYALEQISNLFFQRDGMDSVLGDHAGHIVVDEKNDRFIVSMSTWGDFDFDDVRINYATIPLDTNILDGVHILQTERLYLPTDDLPSATAGQWDPHIVKIKDRWYVAFVNAREFFDFYPVLARSEKGRDFTELTLIAGDASKVETEGTIMQKVGGNWYLLASNGDNSPPEIRDEYPVYDLEMKQLGTLDAPHPTQIPWPMIFPIPVDRRRTRYVLVTFNIDQFFESLLGYGTHGDFFVMEARETRRGLEFPPEKRI